MLHRSITIKWMMVSLAISMLILSTVHPNSVKSFAIPGITGTVTAGGEPAVGINLVLQQIGMGAPVELDVVQTGADGTYLFEDVPTLDAGVYQVSYISGLYGNSVDYELLAYWASPYITSYTAGDLYSVNLFEIGELLARTPSSGSRTSLPAEFSWQPYTGGTVLIYDFYLYNKTDDISYHKATDTTAINLTAEELPLEFDMEDEYSWGVGISTLNTGSGNTNFIPISFSPYDQFIYLPLVIR